MMAAPEKKLPKRDALREIEAAAQQRWAAARVFETDAPPRGDDAQQKYIATFPYPYMNGRLHLGHSFSLSKVEFAMGYERLLGKRCLFPFGFHCTGMPIKACADKLKREVELFGERFEGYSSEEASAEHAKEDAAASSDPAKAKKSKVVAKSSGQKYQFQIMQSMGVPLDEIHKFADAKHWLYYFPPHAMDDLKMLGCKIDWRRAFITTDVNPYYDSFVRWQFNKLRAISPPKVKFGERYTIYSPLDGQPCMDHDRASGEGVGVQEYTGIKLEIVFDELAKEKDTPVKDSTVGKALLGAAAEVLGNRRVYMVAATLRPETMYGQTNCFVGVDLDYAVWEVSPTEAWVCTERAAKNMSWQGLFAPTHARGAMRKLLDIKGWDLVGVPLRAPLATFDKVYVLPMEGVSPTKGTGVVTSVPSDAPDDYITLQDLAKKSAYYHVQPRWIEPFLPPRPIIRTPNYGDLAAVKACEDLKIKSQKDKTQLAAAKDAVYKEGFYSGTMLVGDYAGRPVQDAKPLVKKDMIAAGSAFTYCEPEGVVVSRSGDECCVTLCDQWYLDYGEDSWKAQALECLAGMETFQKETRNNFEKVLDWLNQWACSRSFGLGSRLPWDANYLIESLSDSTIYMAYYTVSHLLHQGSLDGSVQGPAGIAAAQMTDEVWEYILVEGAPFPASSKIPRATLDKLQREFQYFYPLDLRVSGKDLIGNHLTFFIYNHVAIFPKKHWPRAIRANGHLLLNSEKMSKSTGNFMTMRDAIETYGADATRFSLADAGDSLEDANFLDETANAAILKLFTQKEWAEETLSGAGGSVLRTGEYTWIDRVFLNEMVKLSRTASHSYAQMLFRDALKYSFYEFQNARDWYRDATPNDAGMHADLVRMFLEYQALMMAPIVPHWAEHIWAQVLKKDASIMDARWPTSDLVVDEALLASAGYIRDLSHHMRKAEENLMKKAKKSKSGTATPPAQEGVRKVGRLYVSLSFPEWQEKGMQILKSTFDEKTSTFSGKEKELLAKSGLLKEKKMMPFIATQKRSIEQALAGDSTASSAVAALFDRTLAFDEFAVAAENTELLRRQAGLDALDIVRAEDAAAGTLPGGESDDKTRAEAAMPGQPAYRLLFQ